MARRTATSPLSMTRWRGAEPPRRGLSQTPRLARVIRSRYNKGEGTSDHLARVDMLARGFMIKQASTKSSPVLRRGKRTNEKLESSGKLRRHPAAASVARSKGAASWKHGDTQTKLGRAAESCWHGQKQQETVGYCRTDDLREWPIPPVEETLPTRGRRKMLPVLFLGCPGFLRCPLRPAISARSPQTLIRFRSWEHAVTDE